LFIFSCFFVQYFQSPMLFFKVSTSSWGQ